MNIHKRALEILDRDGWVQHRFHTSDGHCTVGLYEQALAEQYGLPIHELDDINALADYDIAIRELVAYNFDGQEKPDFTTSSVMTWNDALGRTAADIREVLKKAAEAYDLEQDKLTA